MLRPVSCALLVVLMAACTAPQGDAPAAAPTAAAVPAPVTTLTAPPPAGGPTTPSSAPATPVATVPAAPQAQGTTTPPVTLAAPAVTSVPPPVATTVPVAPPSTPSRPAPAPRPEPKGKIVLPAKPGAVTFDHGKHAGTLKVACGQCHHDSRPEKPLAAQHQACRECHTTPATAPVRTSLQGAFHDPRATTGTCIDCHRKAGSSRKAPVKCLECHAKGR